MLHCCVKGVLEAGVDEAGRGPIAGPVVAAAVILPPKFNDPRLRDSKKMSERSRTELEPIIKQEAVAWAVAEVSEKEIDSLNILQATFVAMNRAIEALSIRPELLLIDGNRFKSQLGIDYRCFVGGDDLYLSIAAASVLAKTARDRRMKELHQLYPQYDWASNKGYPTVAHKAAVAEFGVSEFHRKTFRGVAEWVNTLF